MSIPKKIHYCWFGYGKKNELFEKCVASWRKYCPDCEIIEWNESNYDVSKNKYMKQAYDLKRWGFVSDYARLDIIYEHGGVYLDTDVEVVRSLDELFEGQGFLGFEKPVEEKEGNYFVNTGHGFGAVQGCEVILKMRDIYEKIEFWDEAGKENLTTCPFYNTRVLENLGLKKDNSMQIVNGIAVYPDDYFCPFSWKTRTISVTDKTFSVHHFNASWLSDKEKRMRKVKRNIDYVLHMPNMIIKSILGENKYELIKRIIKGK